MPVHESAQPRIAFSCANTQPEPWLKGLRSAVPGAQVSVWEPGQAIADYAVVWAPPQAFFDEQTQLKAIFNIGAGVDALMRLRLPQGVPVVRLEDAGMAVQMAEYVCQSVIRFFRELDVVESSMRQAKWELRKPRRRKEFPVGVLGLGVLGQRVAQALSHFEFPVLGFSRSPKQVPGVQCFHGESQWMDFLARCRVLVNLLPLTTDTQGILNRQTLSSLMPGAYLVNVARGAHLVEQDLLDLIHSGHMAGATLDVFCEEPLPPQHPFWHEPRLILTPHTSARTLREDTIEQIAGKLAALIKGEKISGQVDLGAGY